MDSTHLSIYLKEQLAWSTEKQPRLINNSKQLAIPLRK